ncbi:MAG: MaoC family dehydratase N-terminal domain-containing protein [Pseudomonadales bacterium]|nr:MaoC family dehydratase N-terminal domain-containing protein [Pseudomonadales bacterium]
MSTQFNAQSEIAQDVAVDLSKVRHPHYGRYLEEYVPGQIFVHPRGFTFFRSQMEGFSRQFMQMNPLYLNADFARAHGFSDLPAAPQMVFNVILSLGVQYDSEKVIANLGYYDAQFLEPVYPGDTVEALTQVMDRKERGEGKPGIVTIRTLGVNQRGKVVLQYVRKLLVAGQGERPDTTPLPAREEEVVFPWVEDASTNLPENLVTAVQQSPSNLTGWNTYAEDFSAGDIIAHSIGRTITDEHYQLTYKMGNTHPLLYDQIFSQGQSGKMSGTPIVYGGLVFAWLDGLASRDVSENTLWEVGFTEGYHTQPAIEGDTVAPITRILSVTDAPGELAKVASIVTTQLIGVKNIQSAAAIDKHGEDLFIKENDKKGLGKDKITDKIFEIERQLLIKKRDA